MSPAVEPALGAAELRPSARDRPGGPEYGRLVDAMRLLQDRVAGAAPALADVGPLTERIQALADDLAAVQVTEERELFAGRRLDLPGRGHSLMLPWTVEEWTDERLVARVVFRPFYLGSNGAAHGGAIPLVFDEVLGRLSGSGGRPVTRTAFLKVNYRAITRIGADLRLEATLDRTEGRKLWLSGRLYDGETVVSDAESLFVQLRPGQP